MKKSKPADYSDYCTNPECMQRFEGKTPQESVNKLIAHRAICPHDPDRKDHA